MPAGAKQLQMAPRFSAACRVSKVRPLLIKRRSMMITKPQLTYTLLRSPKLDESLTRRLGEFIRPSLMKYKVLAITDAKQPSELRPNLFDLTCNTCRPISRQVADRWCTTTTRVQLLNGSLTLPTSSYPGLYAEYSYCRLMVDGSVCWSDAMCASNYCRGNEGGLKKGVCTKRKENNEMCAENGQCLSDACARLSAAKGEEPR